MAKKKRKLTKKEQRAEARAVSWRENDGVHAVVSGNAPSPEVLDEMTRAYQQKIRKSPLREEMVREFGEEEAERLLKEFRVEIR